MFNMTVLRIMRKSFALVAALSLATMSAPAYGVTCGQDVAAGATSGVITSPNYPNTYRDYDKCSWHIKIPTGNVIRFTFETPFQLESEVDFLKVLDTRSGERRQTQLWTGDCVPKPFYTDTNEVDLVFTTDHSVVQKGFKVTWVTYDASCGLRIASGATSGELSSPSYPNHYANRLPCVWPIKVSPGSLIQITFLSPFSLDDGFDFLKVFDTSSGKRRETKAWTGTTVPQQYLTESNDAELSFIPMETKVSQGFKLTWKQWDIKECAANPSPCKGPSSDCIELDGGFECNCTDTGYKLDVHNQTCVDIDECLPDGQSDCVTPKICSNTIGSYTCVCPDGLIEDGATCVDCSGTYSDPKGNITLPQFGGQYPNNVACEWTIKGTQNNVIHLNFPSTFHIESSSDGKCSYDYVEILDNTGSGSGVSRGRYCGNTAPPTIVASSSTVVIRFHSDRDKTATGFSLAWDTYCGQVYEGLHGNVTSPNYPLPYPHNADCKWEIRVPDGFAISLDFASPFEIEGDADCDTDHLQVFDFNSRGKQVLRSRFCGHRLPKTQVSTSSRMLLVLHTDDAKAYPGFKAAWNAVPSRGVECGGVYKSSSNGSLSTPGYPAIYPDNVECRWDIEAGRAEERIKIEFEPVFGLERDVNGDCYDYLEIWDILTNGSVVSNGRWCEARKAPVFYSASSRVVINFHSDADKAGKGFSASWKAVTGCGENFETANGHLFSPNFPHDYNKNEMCQWELTPPSDTNITLRFDPLFDIEISNGCAWDYLQMTLDGSSLGKWCGLDIPHEVKVTGGQRLKVVFNSDKSNVGKGFYASWIKTVD